MGVADVEEIYRPQRRFYDFDYDMALSNMKTTDSVERPFGGIEVTTEVVTEFHHSAAGRNDSIAAGSGDESRQNLHETESERRLIVR